MTTLVVLNRKKGSLKAQLTRLETLVADEEAVWTKIKLDIKLKVLAKMASSVEELRSEYFDTAPEELDITEIETALLELDERIEELELIKMGKRKVKPKKNADPVVEEKLRQLDELKQFVTASFSEYETYLLGLSDEKCNRVKKMYADKLKSIPDNIRHMTIAQMIEHQEENSVIESSKKEDAIRSVIEKGKMMSEKKKTLKKEKKRSISVNASSKHLAISRPPTNTFSRLSRTVSESALNTPSRSNQLSNMVVTPKFNPKYPVSSIMARVPKPGELVMSMSGSPLQNIVSEGKVTLSLGGGKVLQLSEDTDLEKELKSEIDEPLKKTFKNLREQLDKILQA